MPFRHQIRNDPRFAIGVDVIEHSEFIVGRRAAQDLKHGEIPGVRDQRRCLSRPPPQTDRELPPPPLELEEPLLPEPELAPPAVKLPMPSSIVNSAT
jgi:hypothetical protein